MLNSILANIIAGLGLIFSGLRMVDANLRQATGRRLRTTIGRLTENAWISAAVGIATGALVQSTSGIAFILVSLVTSGLTTVRAVLPIITWANVGCSALIFVAILDLRFVILYLIGLAGAAFAFDRSHKNHALGALFGVGMLFYGGMFTKMLHVSPPNRRYAARRSTQAASASQRGSLQVQNRPVSATAFFRS